jgi:hypothetical protein
MTSDTPLKKYLDENYEKSAFDLAGKDPLRWVYHLHGRRIVSARLLQISTCRMPHALGQNLIGLYDGTALEETIDPNLYTQYSFFA